MKLSAILYPRLFLGIFAAIILTMAKGVHHDYIAYTLIWMSTIAGDNPWSLIDPNSGWVVNTYGPLHVALTPLFRIDPLLPKLVFVVAFMAAGAVLVRDMSMKDAPVGSPKSTARFVVFLFLFNPLSAITVYAFGLNDAVIVLCVALAFHFRKSDRFAMAGVALALGGLLKFYPLLLCPLFMLCQRRGLVLRGLASCLAVFLAGMALSVAVWGDSALSPFTAGAGREPTMLSILRFLDATTQGRPLHGIVTRLIDHNAVLVIGVATGVVLWCWVWRVAWPVAVLYGMVLILATYKVGHPQFYLAWMFAVFWVFVQGDTVYRHLAARKVAICAMPVLAYLMLFQSVYFISGVSSGYYLGSGWGWVGVYGSVPLVALIAGSLLCCRKDLAPAWAGRPRLSP